MSIQTIYIDLGDEITTVIEKIKASHEPIVALVTPKGAVLTQSIVNLKLAKKAAIDAEKDVILVTGDPIGKNLATQVGMSVATTEKDVAAVARGEVDGATEGSDSAKVIAGVRIHRYYDEPAEEKAEEQKTTPDPTSPSSEPEPPVIVPKQLFTTPQENKGPIEKDTAVETKPEKVAEPNSSSATAESESASSETPSLPETPPVVAAPVSVPVVTRKRIESPGIEEPPVVETIASLPSENQPVKTPKTIIPTVKDQGKASQKRRGKGLALALLLILILLLAGGGASVLFLPKTTVTLIAQATPIEQTIEINAKQDQAAVNEDGTLVPTTVLTEKSEVSVPFSATGKKKVGETAKGTATLFNNGDSEPLSLPSGATLVANGRTFTTQADVTVPGAVFQAGKLTRIGQATVPVVATEVGAESNLGETVVQITQPTTRLSGQITSTTGGSSQELTIVSAADISAARTAAETQLRQALAGKLEEQMKNRDIRFDPTTDTVTIDSFTTSVAAGGEATSVQANAVGSITRIGVDAVVIEQAAKKRMVLNQPATEQRIFTKIKDDLALETNTETKSILLTATYLGKSTPVFNPDPLNGKLAGKTLAEGRSYLLDSTPASNVTVTQQPSWWPLKRYPALSRSISVTVQYE